MRAECFFDTNVFVYAVDNSAEEVRKKRIATELIAKCEFGLSAQVLQEFYETVTRKLKRPLSMPEAVQYLDRLQAFPLVPVDGALVTEGICNSERYQFSYWDGAIVAAAERLGCETLYSEDLNHGQCFKTVRVVNPFR